MLQRGEVQDPLAIRSGPWVLSGNVHNKFKGSLAGNDVLNDYMYTSSEVMMQACELHRDAILLSLLTNVLYLYSSASLTLILC